MCVDVHSKEVVIRRFFIFSKKYLNSVDKNMWECYLNSRKVLALRYKEC